MQASKYLKIIAFMAALFPHFEALSQDLTGLSASYHRFSRLNTPATKVEGQDWVGLSLEKSWRLADKKSFHADMDSRYYLKNEAFNFSLAQVFWAYRDERNTLTIGRRILDWNPGEAFWGLNAFNARQGFTLLDQEQEGLLGVAFKRQMGDLSVEFFASYLTIPQLNPGIDIEDGVVKSRSEWVKLPPRRTTFQGVDLDIIYKLNDPDILQDIVLKKSLGAKLDFKWDQGKVAVFGIYKPENSIRVNAFVEQIDPVADTVTITAEPVVNHHVVLGAHIEQKFMGVNWRAAIDYTDPNAKLGKDFEAFDPVQLNETNRVFRSDDFVIEPSYDRESYLRFSAEKRWRRHMFDAHAIQLLTKDIRGDDFFSDAEKWRSAIGFHYEGLISDKLRLMVDLKYDVKRKDNILRTEASYRLMPRLKLIVGAELLKAPSRNSYWSAYRANDTLYGQLSYFF